MAIMTRDEYEKLKKGVSRVKVVGNSCSHSYTIGKVYVYHSFYSGHDDSGMYLAEIDNPTRRLSSYCEFEDVEKVALSRNAELKELREDVKKAQEKYIQLVHELEVRTRYKSALDELSQTLFAEIQKEDKLTAPKLYGMLKALGLPLDIKRGVAVTEEEKKG